MQTYYYFMNNQDKLPTNIIPLDEQINKLQRLSEKVSIIFEKKGPCLASVSF